MVKILKSIYNIYTAAVLKFPIKKILFFVFLIFINCSVLEAQSTTWQKVLTFTNNSALNKAQQTSDGGYIAIGENRIGIYSKIFLIKFNLFGDTLWSRFFDLNINKDFAGNWIEETSDKGFIICGYGTVVNTEAYLIKTDSVGNILWFKTFGGNATDVGRCVKQTKDGGFILAVWTHSSGSSIDVMLIKTDSLGNQIWSKKYINNNSNDYVNEIRTVGNYGYILVGSKSVIGDSANIYVIRTNIIGDTLWTNNYGGQRSSAGYSIDNADENGFIVAGVSNSFNPNYYSQSYLVKIDSLGNIIWERYYSSYDYETAFSIKKLNNNEYVFCGTSDSVKRYDSRAFIRKIDLNGNIIIEKFYRGGDNSNKFYSVDLAAYNGFILCGYATFVSSPVYSYICKTDSLGNVSTKINNSNSSVMNNYKLFQNYPNPFNPVTKISFELPNVVKVNLIVYDLLGREIKSIVNSQLTSGKYTFEFDGSNFSSGVYFYKITAGSLRGTRDFSAVKRMVLLK